MGRDRQDPLLFPFLTESMPKIELRGRTFYYEQVGDQGAPLVFLTGLGGDHRAFSRPQRHFADRYQTFAFDARDSGQSDRAQADYTTADMAGDVAAWLEAIRIGPAHVVGQSLGGLVAQELALSRPELVKSLVLASTHSGAAPWRQAVIESWIAMRTQLDAGAFTRAVLPWLVAPAYYEREGGVLGLIQYAERNPWPQDAAAFARLARAAMTHQARDRLHAIAVPCLVLVGEFDLVNPPRISEELVRLIPGARLVVIPGAGHMPHIEDQTRFRGAIEAFLAQAERSATTTP